jgi:hypothetical protein
MSGTGPRRGCLFDDGGSDIIPSEVVITYRADGGDCGLNLSFQTAEDQSQVSKMIVLPPRSECVVPVQCAAPGLRLLQARLRDNAAGVHMANGVAEIWPNQPFNVRVLNTSTTIHRLPKGMVLGHALPHPTSMMALIADTDVVDVPETETPPSSQDSTVGDQEQVQENLSPMEYGLERDPPPLPDRTNV